MYNSLNTPDHLMIILGIVLDPPEPNKVPQASWAFPLNTKWPSLCRPPPGVEPGYLWNQLPGTHWAGCYTIAPTWEKASLKVPVEKGMLNTAPPGGHQCGLVCVAPPGGHQYGLVCMPTRFCRSHHMASKPRYKVGSQIHAWQ